MFAKVTKNNQPQCSIEGNKKQRFLLAYNKSIFLLLFYFSFFALQALDTLSTVAPLCLEDYMTCQSNTRLLLLLEWCVGQGTRCQAVSCWLGNISPSLDPISTQNITRSFKTYGVEEGKRFYSKQT